MRFTWTGNTTYTGAPKPWGDYGEHHENTIHKFFFDVIKVYDADTCGDKTIDFVFEDGFAYRLEYSWWFSINDHEDYHELCDEWSVSEIALEEANVPSKTFRDWVGTMVNVRVPKAKVE